MPLLGMSRPSGVLTCGQRRLALCEKVSRLLGGKQPGEE